MTITDAIIRVLEKVPEGLTVAEIYSKIVEQDYYNFGAEDPKGVVAIQLKRYCEGQKISNPSSVKYFISEGTGKKQIFKLKHYKGESMGELKVFKHIKTTISGIDIYTFPMTVSDLANISYVAIRGKDNEEGAVQRVLNKQRIASITSRSA